MQPILPDYDYYNTTRAYFFCGMGIVLVDGFIRIPTAVSVLVRKGKIKLAGS